MGGGDWVRGGGPLKTLDTQGFLLPLSHDISPMVANANLTRTIMLPNTMLVGVLVGVLLTACSHRKNITTE